MCVICQSGPQLLVGVPAAGLVVSRIRAALSRSQAPAEPVSEPQRAEDDAR